jgi:peptidoglycan/xylan/chitin deacetylase (PgdA/CDA1 family)
LIRNLKKLLKLFTATTLIVAVSPFPTLIGATTLTPTAQVSFTFDDGLASSRTLAADTMATTGVTGTNYIISGCVGMTTVPNTCAADGDKPYMTWSQISELHNIYGWEIGSHTVTHPYLASTDPQDQPVKLTLAQVTSELLASRDALAAQGYTATDFATPYGDYEPDGHPVLASIAKYYASHRGYADVGYNTFPYNDYLLVDQQILSSTTVNEVKGYIDAAKANNQWLILTFHEIVASGAQSTSDEYDYNVSDLAEISSYAKNSGIRVVSPKDALVTNAGNLLPDSSFNQDIAVYSGANSAWSTDDQSLVSKNTASNGSYPDFQNSVQMTSSSTKNAHLYSPRIIINSAKKYILKSFINITSTVGEIAFYIDEYDQNNAYIGSTARYMGSAYSTTNPRVKSLNLEYTPSALTTSARLQIVLAAGSGSLAYLDNIQWFANDGTTTSSGVIIPPTTAKPGDVNVDGAVNILDLSIMSTNWGKSAGATRNQGDLSGDGKIDILDLSILATNWGK